MPGGWLQEGRRSYVAMAAGVAVGVGAVLVLRSRGEAPGENLEMLLLLVLASYLVTYVLGTFLAFARTAPSRYLTWAKASRPGTWVDHYILGTHPGPGTAQGVSIIALALGVFWYPRALAEGLLPPVVGGLLVAVMVVGAWATVVLTYSVAYLMKDARSGHRELEFPGEAERRSWTDYLYFSAGVSTTFAASDVQILSPRMRRTVTGHSILAFGFNTVILAAVVSLLLR
ncbi:DUF1345 domain-containing protein [Ornithinimicrobium faecis]|uniref:DUF1345 domain-containing protein n=1 Tax=Ornithinimicrobium faecis TaxID=2934158 RepID=A0ABY4YT30_9MICO|nr:DUF1345 domain-containing protein [Ornithinimicrobium sp. HY1793]USQ79302.1 DUF1345 domain-containing protein [Ornithinimicrobium sp. HY1793]